jgi:hypothetical protein
LFVRRILRQLPERIRQVAYVCYLRGRAGQRNIEEKVEMKFRRSAAREKQGIVRKSGTGQRAARGTSRANAGKSSHDQVLGVQHTSNPLACLFNADVMIPTKDSFATGRA